MDKIHLKICGVMKPDDATKLAEMGVEYIGLNFIGESTRRIEIETAMKIVSPLKASPVKTVALFRDQPLEYITETVSRVQPAMVQLHGSEHHSYVDSFKVPVIKSVPVGQNASPNEIHEYMRHYSVEYYLLDRETQGLGEGVDLKLAKLLIDTNQKKIILAGGITPDNIDEILSQVQPFGIDISSGIRTDNEIDFTKVERVIKSIRSGS